MGEGSCWPPSSISYRVRRVVPAAHDLTPSLPGVAYKRLVLHKQGMDMFPNVVPAPLVDGLLFVKDMALVSVLTVWESVSSLVARVTGRRGGGFRGLPQDDERGLFDAMEDD
jgi:hypothetical protein